MSFVDTLYSRSQHRAETVIKNKKHKIFEGLHVHTNYSIKKTDLIVDLAMVADHKVKTKSQKLEK